MAEQTLGRSSGPSGQSGSRPGRMSSHSEGASDFKPSADLMEYMKAYARDRPEVAALWCFGIGFILGWKLKLW